MEFQYQVTKCDVPVAGQAKLLLYRDCLKRWQGWLFEDEHAIWQQIHRMLWNDMVFRTINECRRLAAENPDDAVGFNPTILEFIDQSYASTQLLAIRRLTEQARSNDAISIPRLLRDMKSAKELFTREHFVCHDGLLFDGTLAREKFSKQVQTEEPNRGKIVMTRLPTSGHEAFDTTELAHNHFDALLRGGTGHRSRDDRLDPAIFDNLNSKLGFLGDINKVTSKFIAHAADGTSRKTLNSRERTVTLNKISACHRAIVRIATYISNDLLYFGQSDLIPITQFDLLKNLDKGLVTSRNLKQLNNFWDCRAREVEKYVNGNWREKFKPSQPD